MLLFDKFLTMKTLISFFVYLVASFRCRRKEESTSVIQMKLISLNNFLFKNPKLGTV